MAKSPKQHRASWTTKVVADLKRMAKNQHPVKTIAKTLARTEAAVRKKAFDLGVSFRRRKKSTKKAKSMRKASRKKAA